MARLLRRAYYFSTYTAMKFQIGQIVKPGERTISDKRLYWMQQGSPQKKAQAYQWWQDAENRRGAVTECDEKTVTVAWEDGSVSNGFHHMFQPA